MKDERRSRSWIVGIVGVFAALLLAGVIGWLLRGEQDRDIAELTDRPGDGADLIDGRGRLQATGLLDESDLALGSIAGTVRDHQGTPIPDAQVCARGNSDEMAHTAFRFPRCTTTDRDGHYRVEGLLPATYGVGAQAASFLPSSRFDRGDSGERGRMVGLARGADVSSIDFVLRPGGVRLAGTVMDIGGGVVEGAWVSAQTGTWAISDANGRFELWVSPGRKYIGAQAPGYAPAFMEAFPPTDLADLYLVPESTISGRVVLAGTDRPVAGIGIYRSRYEGWPPFAITDLEGRFLVDGLEPGRYELEARSDEYYGRTASDVATTLGEARDGVVIEVSGAVAVEGKIVIAERDEPCPNGSVSLHPRNGGEVLTDAIDEHDAGLVTIPGVVPGTYRVIVKCEGFLVEGEIPDLEVPPDAPPLAQLWTVRPGVSISGTVLTADGDPVADAQVQAQASPGTPDAPSATATTDNDGSFEISGLDAARYDAFVSSCSVAPTPSASVLLDLSSGSDQADVEIRLAAAAVLEGRVTDTKGRPIVGARVDPAPPRGIDISWSRAQQDITDADGRYRVVGLSAGDYRVRVGRTMSQTFRHPGQGPEDPDGVAVTVVAGRDNHLDIEVIPNDLEINGVVTSLDGPVADAFVHFVRMSESAASNGTYDREATRWGQLGAKPILTDVDGRFTISDLQEGRYVIRAHRRGGGEAFAEGVAAGAEVELEIEETGSVEGRVALEGGDVPNVLRLSLVDEATGRDLDHQSYATNGGFRFERVPAGDYTLIVKASEGSATQKVKLSSGESKRGVLVRLRRTHTVRGKVVALETGEPLPGLVVYANSFTDRSFQIEEDPAPGRITKSNGTFELEAVPTGKITLLILPHHFQGVIPEYGLVSMVRAIAPEPKAQDLGEIKLIARRVFGDDEPGDLGFKLREWEPHDDPDTEQLVVATVRPGGPADIAGMQVGDELVSIDGHDVSHGDPDHKYAQLLPVKPGATVQIGVARGDILTMTAVKSVQP